MTVKRFFSEWSVYPMTFCRVICSCYEEKQPTNVLGSHGDECVGSQNGNKKVPPLIYLFSRYLLSKNKSQWMLFLTLERSYISLCVFLCQVKFMKKGISEETLADLCYCDTSSIYLVTSGRKDPYCAEKIPVTIVCQDLKGRWEVSWHCSGVTSDRSLLLWEFPRCCWEKPICAVQITGLRPQILGWDRSACACLYVLQVIVVIVHHKI